VVLAIVGLLAGAVVPGLGRLLDRGGPEDTLERVREELVLARMEALRGARAERVEVAARGGVIEVRRGAGQSSRVRRVPASWLGAEPFGGEGAPGQGSGASDGSGEPMATRGVVFGSMGRASAPALRFQAVVGGGPGGRGTMTWMIAFDPVTGAVGRVEPEDEGDGR